MATQRRSAAQSPHAGLADRVLSAAAGLRAGLASEGPLPSRHDIRILVEELIEVLFPESHRMGNETGALRDHVLDVRGVEAEQLRAVERGRVLGDGANQHLLGLFQRRGRHPRLAARAHLRAVHGRTRAVDGVDGEFRGLGALGRVDEAELQLVAGLRLWRHLSVRPPCRRL